MEFDISALFTAGSNLALLGVIVKLLLKMDRRLVILETKFEGLKNGKIFETAI